MGLSIASDCVLCLPDQEQVIWWNDFARVIAVRDEGYPIFCRVITNRHWVEFSDLSSTDRIKIMHVVYVVERTLRTLLNPTKVNIASFGNLVPHLHWHVIPRFESDPHYPNPIWGAQTEGQPVFPPEGFWEQFRDSIKEQLAA
ncbi:MAG: HIT family protein [Proteobacteria bacterium]|nr:HIT family protein [Pseudomonadota bacterium]MDA1331489.1 HIT family protein [Pseudomonadota bacterium]